ncbi:hypothetical protein Barb6_02659 [Bacteroidales bacterium Barb6]|nr:hypothetical protein Barb6_02659 [Bacteroidales bacterium Barb6]
MRLCSSTLSFPTSLGNRHGTAYSQRSAQGRQRTVYLVQSDCGIERHVHEAVCKKKTLHLSIMARLESDIQRQIIQRLEAEGWYAIKLILNNRPGIPDFRH